MDNPHFVILDDPRSILTGKDEELWLPLSESPMLGKLTETVDVAGAYFDVLGYSEVREALLLRPIAITGAADNLEEEVEKFLAEQ